MKNLNCEDCLWSCSCNGECCDFCFACDERFENEILPRLLEENAVRSEMWMEVDENDLSEEYYYSEGINDSLLEIRSGETAFLYNLREVADVLSFEPEVHIVLNDGIYYARK